MILRKGLWEMKKNDGYDHLRNAERSIKVSMYGEEQFRIIEEEQNQEIAILNDLLVIERDSEIYQKDIIELTNSPWNYNQEEVIALAERRAKARAEKKLFKIMSETRMKQQLEFLNNIESDRLSEKKYTISNTTIEQIDLFSGIEFEIYIAELFKILNYRIETTKSTGDFGVDLIISRNLIRTAIQAKRYAENVGITAIQEVVSGAIYYKCDNSMVVTNSYFSNAAKKLGANLGVILINRVELIKLIKSIS
jgi:restriction system protein